MNPKIRSFCLVAVTGTVLFSWLIVLGFTFREWHAVSLQIRMSMVGLVISYPLPWVKLAKDKFATWGMAMVTYMALLNAVLLVLFLAPPPGR
jgi:hypothetical protein